MFPHGLEWSLFVLKSWNGVPLFGSNHCRRMFTIKYYLNLEVLHSSRITILMLQCLNCQIQIWHCYCFILPLLPPPHPPWQQEAGLESNVKQGLPHLLTLILILLTLWTNAGQKFILALGEIYRVVKVLGASARLFKLWVLLSSAKVDIFVLLEECSTIWSSSGLEDALHCICDPVGFEYDATVQALLASIKHVHDLDVLPLQNHIFAQQKPICQLSLLTPEMVPGKWISGESSS